MTNFANVIFPQNQPVTGLANYVAQPVAPSVGVSNYVATPSVPQVGVRNKVNNPVMSASVGANAKNADPYNTATPAVAVANHTPLLTPIGVSPQFETPTEVWSYDYGNGGGYGYGSQF